MISLCRLPWKSIDRARPSRIKGKILCTNRRLAVVERDGTAEAIRARVVQRSKDRYLVTNKKGVL